jgi:hypothetical protein
MGLADDLPVTSGYPHLISLGPDRNIRWLIDVGNVPRVADGKIAHAFHARGAIAPDGTLTPIGRQTIVDGVARKAGANTFCIVWSEVSCTYVLPDGSTTAGRKPPRGEPIYPEEYDDIAIDLVDIRWIALPEDCDWPYLSIRRLDRDHVELASAEPMMIGHFDELPLEGRGSELRSHLDEDGRLIPPAFFRGVRTNGVRNGTTLLGPIQPNGCDVRIVEPWPHKVFAAAAEIAGRALSPELLRALWDVVDPIDRNLLQCGVREAA